MCSTLDKIKKVQLKLWLPEELVKDFKEIVKNKYEGMQGISWEAEEALRSWIGQHHTQIHTNKMNPARPQMHHVMDQIINTLRQEHYVNIQCPRKLLIQAISEVRGSDDRTINKWMKLMLRESRIKMLNYNVFEIV